MGTAVKTEWYWLYLRQRGRGRGPVHGGKPPNWITRVVLRVFAGWKCVVVRKPEPPRMRVVQSPTGYRFGDDA